MSVNWFPPFPRSIRRRRTAARNLAAPVGRLGLPILCLVAGLPTDSPNRAFAQSPAAESPASQGLKSVVTLRVYGETGERVGLGSGFVLPDGRIVTNAHVVGGASWIEVLDRQGRFLGNATYTVAISTSLDLAILPAIQGVGPGLPLAGGEPKPGDPIWVIGSPMGLGGSVSTGVVSALRTLHGRELLQITAPISTGSSGGPILNDEGRVVGVTVSFLEEGQNLNFGVSARDLSALLRSAPGRFEFPPRSSVRSSREAMRGDDDPGVSNDYRAIAELAVEIRLDTVARGTLVREQDLESDGKYVDLYRFRGLEGERVSVVAISDDFDTYLWVVSLDDYLANENEVWLRDNDDSGEGTNSFLELDLPRTGEYVAAITSYEEGATGDYALLLARASAAELHEWLAEASEDRWTHLGTNADSTSFYIDSETIERDGRRAFVWLQTLYPNVQRNAWNEAYDELKARVEVDCRRRRFRYGQGVMYLNESMVRSTDLDRDWMPVVPGSVSEAGFEVVCSGR